VLYVTFNDNNLTKRRLGRPKPVFRIGSTRVLEEPKIIDTRGIDVGQSRPDLESYIRDQEGVICLFTDGFNAAPSPAVFEVISRYLTPESQDIASKLVHMVLPRRGEPEKAMGSAGKVESREEGIAIKKNEIDNRLREFKFLPENVLFYDAFRCYLEDGRLNSLDYTLDDVCKERQRICEEIDKIISYRKTALSNEVDSLSNKVDAIRKGQGLNQSDYQLVIGTKEQVKGYRFLNLPKGNFLIEKYLELWEGKKRYAMQLRATVNRFGVYEFRNIDIYFDAALVAEQLAREFMENPKDQIMNLIADLEENASETSGLKSMVASFETQINYSYEQLVREIGQLIMQTVKKFLSPLDGSNRFWNNAQNRWGKGSGYKDDVLSMFADELEKINDYFNEESQKLWEEKLLKKVVAFFG